MNKFKDERDYLIHLLACAVNECQPEEMPPEFSFGKVFEFGKTHEVANSAYLSVEKLYTKPEDGLLSLWQQEYWKSVTRDTAQKKAAEEIRAALHENGIATVEVQGSVVKKYYPATHLRMMSDIDFVVPLEKLDAAENVLQTLGYSTAGIRKNSIDAEKGIIHIELHTDFFRKDTPAGKVMPPADEKFRNTESLSPEMSETEFYLYHLLHTVKHFVSEGCGIRRITDLYYLENALKTKVDYALINEKLSECGFFEIKENLLAVKDLWFNGITPEHTDVSDTINEIFAAGNHGTAELYHRHKLEKEKSRKFFRIRHILSAVFPEKDKMLSYYPELKKKNPPYLFCLIYRFIKIAADKSGTGKIRKKVSEIKKS